MTMEDRILYTNVSNAELYEKVISVEYSKAAKAYINGRYCRTFNDFMADIATALCFPDWFGYNWAAFDDCITDFNLLNPDRVLIVIYNAADLFAFDNAKVNKELLRKHLNLAIEYLIQIGMPVEVIINNFNS